MEIQKNNAKDTRQLMSDAKFHEAYGRYDELKQRYETWDESVERVMDTHRFFYKDKIKNCQELLNLMDEVERGYKDKLFLGSQRTLQFGGKQLLKKHERSYNCAASYCDRPNFFSGYFFLLLAGAGVGMSLQFHHVNKLPEIKKRSNHTKTYVVPDSIEGWANTIDVLLSSYFTENQVYPEYAGKKVNFDLSEIRPKGSFISGGFRAPGAEPLRKALDLIESKIEQALKEGCLKLKPIQVYDICMYIADCVIAGSIRRSATICLFSKTDNEMLNAKVGNWFVENPQRGRSNNSVVLVRDEVTKEEFDNIINSVKDYGEPGFIFADSNEFVYNPCFTGDMRLLTKEGYKHFEELENHEVEIINKDGDISVSKIWCSGEKEVIQLTLSNGNNIKCTPDHVFMLNDGTECMAENTLNKELKNNHFDIIVVENIIKLGIEKVYDFSEPLTHWGIVEGVVVHNCAEVGFMPITEDGRSGFITCNLSEINGAKSITKEIFFEQCKLASIIGTIQAGYTNFMYFKDATKELIERDSLIGVGITGIMNNPNILLDKDVLTEGANIVKHWNLIVSKMLGINQAARTTVIKPSGNSSVLLGCSSGIHGEHSKRYIRHVQTAKDSEVGKLFLEKNPNMCEDSVWNKERDIVMAFPIENSDNSLFKKDLLGVKQLEAVKLVQQYWVETGTNVELCNHPKLRNNVSNTISVDNWNEVADYIYENRQYFAGISLLAQVGDKNYPQAPFTEVFTYQQIVDKYGEVSMFTSALIEAGLNAFDNNLWLACSTVMGSGLILKDDHSDLLKRDFVRRVLKFSKNFKNLEDCVNCLKDVYNLHKYWKIQTNLKDIDWSYELSNHTYTDVDTMGATGCAGGACEL